jgi:hypothetical protein
MAALTRCHNLPGIRENAHCIAADCQLWRWLC